MKIKTPSRDFWIALALGGGITLLACHAVTSAETTVLISFAGVLATIGVTLVGFVITALTILAAVAHRRLSVNLSKTKHNETLLTELFGVAAFFLSAGIASLVAFVANDLSSRILIAASMAYCGLGILLLMRAAQHFYNVMLVLGESQH